MKGLIYQLKSVRKDKFCMMSFLLPVVVAAALNFVGSIDLSSLGEFQFGVVAHDTTSEMENWLEEYGSVTVYQTREELILAINEPSTNLIGVERNGNGIKTIISGDELGTWQQTANTLPSLYEQRETSAQTSMQVLERPDILAGYQNIFIAIILTKAELLALTAADFDFEKETVKISKSYQRLHGEDVITTPKTKKSNRTIKMPHFLCEEMQEYLGMLYGLKKKDRIFTVTKSYLHHEMDRGARAAGVKRIRIHDLRHSHISLLIDMGFSAVAIADRVGHESIDITYQYAHLFPSKQAEMADRLDDLGKGDFENVG